MDSGIPTEQPYLCCHCDASWSVTYDIFIVVKASVQMQNKPFPPPG